MVRDNLWTLLGVGAKVTPSALMSKLTPRMISWHASWLSFSACGRLLFEQEASQTSKSCPSLREAATWDPRNIRVCL